jgi:hypothetical protein
MLRTRIKSGGSRQKKTRHLPTRRRSSPVRSLRDFTSPWPVAAKRTRAASIRAWTTRSRRAKSRTAAGRKLRGGSQPEPASDFVQRNVVARFRAGQIQLGHSLGIEDFLLTQFRQKRDGHPHLTVRKGIHKRLKAAAIGGHTSIITSRVDSHFRAEDSSAPAGARIWRRRLGERLAGLRGWFTRSAAPPWDPRRQPGARGYNTPAKPRWIGPRRPPAT